MNQARAHNPFGDGHVLFAPLATKLARRDVLRKP